MSVFTLQANHHLGVPFTAPLLGPVHCEVESEVSISVLVLDGPNFLAWKANQPYNYFAAAMGVQNFRQSVFVPSKTLWYLVMVNFGSLPTAVYFNVKT